MISLLHLLPFGILLVAAQVVAAAPWLTFLNWEQIRPWLKRPFSGGGIQRLVIAAVGVAAAGLALALFLVVVGDSDTLEGCGRLYAALVQLQLLADLFVVLFPALLVIWPKGAAVAQAAFRESIRQPMFWLIFAVFVLLMLISALIPYFTFGEDYIMMKDLDYEWIMMAAALFAVLAASTSISEEIEGRTAITLMSKPISRRQFLLGKFAGILLAALVMTVMLGWFFDWLLLFKHWFDRMDPVPVPGEVTALVRSLAPTGEGADFLRGAGLWLFDVADVWPGLLLGTCQVMVLLAFAVALATRFSLVVNLVSCGIVFFLGQWAPMVSTSTQQRLAVETDPNKMVFLRMVGFLANLLHTVLPSLDLFDIGPALINDTPLPALQLDRWIATVAVYGILYTPIILLLGLILFEDRDLA